RKLPPRGASWENRLRTHQNVPASTGASTHYKEFRMAAIVKQSACAPQAKSVTAADRVAGDTKKGKSSSHLVYVGEVGCEAAAHWLDLNNKLAETERELALARDRVLDVIRPWHEDTCAKRKAHESTVVVETPTGTLRVSFQHRYTKMALDRE